ncbi:PilZ domain-containing protein [Methylobacterium komagatae]|uniref:PilZ domain-containing protein n=1 Tax=Methylobacterium komagatae TaxID=374425 RepID=A0ABW2BRK0_9HYPH
MKERRDVERRRVLLGGLIETAAFLPEIACTIRNVSLTGARIRIAEGSILPERVILRVPIRGECREARIVWRDGDSVGLHFEAVEAAPTPPQRKTVDVGPGEVSFASPKGSLH